MPTAILLYVAERRMVTLLILRMLLAHGETTDATQLQEP
jgi:hypothetical protein